MTCKSCGRDVPAGVSFCPGCGASVSTADSGLTAPSPAFKEVPSSATGNDSTGLIGMILGIVGFVLILFPFPLSDFLSLASGVVGLIFSVKAMQAAKDTGETDTMAILGLIFSILCLVVTVFTVVIPLILAAIFAVILIVYLVIIIIVGVISFILSFVLMLLPLFALPFM